MRQQKWHDDLICWFLKQILCVFQTLKMHFIKNLNILNIGIFMFS